MALLCLSCSENPGADPGEWIEVLEALGDTLEATSAVGAFEEGPQGPAFGSLQSGTIAPGGAWFAVADRDPPHLHVFRSDGTMVASFLGRGEGPTETRAPWHFLLADTDSTLLLLESDQLRRFTLEGRYLASLRLGARGYFPQSMGRGCGDLPFLLAPHREASDGEIPVAWLHRIAAGDPDGLDLATIWQDSTMPGRGVVLGGQRMAHVGNLLMVSRGTREGVKEETLICGKDGSVLSLTARGSRDQIRESVAEIGVIGRSFNRPVLEFEQGREYPLVVGVLPVRERGLLRVTQILSAGPQETDLAIQLSLQVGADTVATRRFSGYFEVLDLVGRQALVVYPEPFPRVFFFELPLGL